MKLYETLCSQLKKENNFVSDNGELKKWVVADKARNYDAGLLALLLANEDLKKTFFKDINGTLVFLLEQFLLFIEQKNYLNDSYTSYRNKIGLTIGGKFLNQRNEVELVWPYKDCILEGGQTKEDQKRPEIFFNQTLAQDEITQLLDPKVLTNAKRYGTDGAHTVSTFTRNAELNRKRGLPENTITDNLIIKGNNLLALHSLKKEFAGKVKLIYIDPPYNTGNDSFGYNDNFNHSTWLTFMKNRLEVARTLLKDDGTIFVQCDDNEQAYLKVLMDDVFKKENFISIVALKMSTISGVKTAHREKTILKEKEYGILYKGKDDIHITPEYISDSEWDEEFQYVLLGKDTGKYSVRKLKDVLEEQKISFDVKSKDFQSFVKEHSDIIWRRAFIRGEMKEKSLSKPNEVLTKDIDNERTFYWGGRQMFFLSEKYHEYYDNKGKQYGPSILLGDMWGDINTARIFNEGGIDFRNAKKPEQLLSRIIRMFTRNNDIVLDFFGGSGTTAAVAHKMNRQYISCEQIDSQMDLITNRLQNVINGDQSGISKSVSWNPQNPSLEDSANGRYERNNFIYLELKKYNQAFIEKIEEADSSEKLLKIWEQMKEKSFLNYNVDIKTQEEHIEDFKQLELAEQKQVLCELLDKNQLYVNVSDMNDERFATTDEEKNVTQAFYSNL